MATEAKNVISQILSDIWWLVLLRGITATLLGILLFTQTGVTLMVFMLFVGAYWFVDGIFTIFASIKGRKYLANWGWGIFTGIISLLAGLVVLGQPLMAGLITASFMIYLVGFMVIISGIFSIVTGIRLRKEIDNEWSMIIGGVLSLLFGFVLIFNPLLSLIVLVYFIGALSLVGGIILIVLSFQIRKAGKAVVKEAA